MYVQSVMSAPAVTTTPDASIVAVAGLMAESGVGAVAVLEHDRLVGVVTDRDLVTRGIAAHQPLDGRVDSVMSPHVISLPSDASVEDALATFRRVPVRRIPVTSASTGQVVGMLTVDDLLVDLARRIGDLAEPVARELLEPQHDAPFPVPREGGVVT
jgi:CBS domain-containing protein